MPENYHMDRGDSLPAAYLAAKRPRPISIDTVQGSSNATFSLDSGEVVAQLPLPGSPRALASNLLLESMIHLSPNTSSANSEQIHSSSAWSSTPSYLDAEIHLAKKITLTKVPNRPTLVYINSFGSRLEDPEPQARYLEPRKTTCDQKPRIFAEESENEQVVPDLADIKQVLPQQPDSLPPYTLTQNDATPRTSHSATTQWIWMSENLAVPKLPPSPQKQTMMLPTRSHLRIGTGRCSASAAATASAAQPRIHHVQHSPFLGGISGQVTSPTVMATRYYSSSKSASHCPNPNCCHLCHQRIQSSTG
jgi:hypothetical protein